MTVEKKIHESYNGDARKMMPNVYYDYNKSLSENVERLKRVLVVKLDNRKLYKGIHDDKIDYAEELKELAPIEINNLHIMTVDWKLEDEASIDIHNAEDEHGYRSDEECQEIKRKLLNQEQAPSIQEIESMIFNHFNTTQNEMISEEEASQLEQRFMAMMKEPITL